MARSPFRLAVLAALVTAVAGLRLFGQSGTQHSDPSRLENQTAVENIRVEVPSRPFTMAATLVLPTTTRVQAVVVISPMEECTSLLEPVEQAIAEAFARGGAATVKFASRRPDRDMFRDETVDALAADCVAAVRHARARFPGTPVGLLGFSTGALIAIRSSELSSDVGFLVLVGKSLDAGATLIDNLARVSDEKKRPGAKDAWFWESHGRHLAESLAEVDADALGKDGGSEALWRAYVRRRAAAGTSVQADARSRAQFFKLVGWMDSAFGKSYVASDPAAMLLKSRIRVFGLLLEKDDVVPFDRTRRKYIDVLGRRLGPGVLLSSPFGSHDQATIRIAFSTAGLGETICDWVREGRVRLSGVGEGRFKVEFVKEGAGHPSAK